MMVKESVTHIVIASLLKPVDDTRMYEKMAKTLQAGGRYHVHIIGFCSYSMYTQEEYIDQYPLFSIKRNSWRRLGAPLNYYKKLLQLKPSVIICNSIDLLLFSIIYRIIFGGYLLYDIRENNYLNIIHTDTYPRYIRTIVAILVRTYEHLTAPFIDHYFLAERTYAQELPFVQGKYTIIENKYNPIELLPAYTPKHISASSIRLLYSGTISTHYGIFEAITLAKAFYSINTNVTLTIIGYCANPYTLEKVKLAIQNNPYIHLIGGDALVPHQQIVEQIKLADIGLLPYHPNPSTANCIPTKLYEYAAHCLPMIITYNPLWENVCRNTNSAVFTNYSIANLALVYDRLLNTNFYAANDAFANLWVHEGEVLLNVIANTLPKNSMSQTYSFGKPK